MDLIIRLIKLKYNLYDKNFLEFNEIKKKIIF
jgi:hypothetical protein